MNKTPSGGRAGAPADRKRAERERLAAALRANLNRRKAQNRNRRALVEAAGETAPGDGEDPAAKR